jgi:parallel beta-helix repeat protein
MNKKITLFFLLMFSCFIGYSQGTVLKKGMVIHKSTKIKKGEYKIEGFNSLEQSVLVIEGNNVVIDFSNSLMIGSSTGMMPDKYSGVALIIRNSKNVTIRNLNAKGYKVALMAIQVEGLVLDHCDFSYNYRQHLNSTRKKENMSDWMSYHNNENDEWLRYGAAIYLKNCERAKITWCKVTGGQNALMMTGCTNGQIYNNDFSFNSGIGIGLYRCSYNSIMYNKINFNVRGYSYGIYSRGQDSAGILVYEQSSFNTFFSNSATHSGDGFFLWAGQTTMNTGAGGCNNNKIIGNDFSFAPTNGIEVTFSSNTIKNNRIYECDYGIWGGYSYQTIISDNQFRNNKTGIAIEHGRDIAINGNIFYQDQEAIHLWSRREQPANWGFSKYRETASAHYLIALNSFNRNSLVYHISGTKELHIFSNTYSNCESIFNIDSTVSGLDTSKLQLFDTLANEESPLKNVQDPFKGNGRMAGRKNIMITEWGPYDFRYPVIWHINADDTSGMMEFRVLGPKGKWKIISFKGVGKPDVVSDTFPSLFKVSELASENTDIEIVAEFSGISFTDQFGKKINAGQPYRFRYKEFFQPVDFTVSWYAWDSTNNPISNEYRTWLKDQKPFLVQQTRQLDFSWWGGLKSREDTIAQFLTIAEGVADVKDGDYELRLTWDDAVRVYIDGKMVLDQWNPSKYQFDESPSRSVKLHMGGKHHIRVEHVELGGFATLALEIKKIRRMSQRIRIKLQSYDHNLVDKSAEKIVKLFAAQAPW